MSKLLKTDLLLRISSCEEVDRAMKDRTHPCNKIVASQNRGRESFQHPEPWNGNIEKADVLIIGSNPSFDPDENYPTNTWNDDQIYSFHNDRFSDPYYIQNKNKVKYWNAMRKCVSWILGIPLDAPHLEDHLCAAEIVHCKSKKQTGFNEACHTCVNKWLKLVLSEFHGEYVVVLGEPAKKRFQIFLHMNPDFKFSDIFYVPHPSRWCYLGTDAKIKEDYFLKICR